LEKKLSTILFIYPSRQNKLAISNGFTRHFTNQLFKMRFFQIIVLH